MLRYERYGIILLKLLEISQQYGPTKNYRQLKRIKMLYYLYPDVNLINNPTYEQVRKAYEQSITPMKIECLRDLRSSPCGTPNNETIGNLIWQYNCMKYASEFKLITTIRNWKLSGVNINIDIDLDKNDIDIDIGTVDIKKLQLIHDRLKVKEQMLKELYVLQCLGVHLVGKHDMNSSDDILTNEYDMWCELVEQQLIHQDKTVEEFVTFANVTIHNSNASNQRTGYGTPLVPH
jgi:hypothetical protein